jgi:transcriptional regulator with GAF, ATPase, and Fis domain
VSTYETLPRAGAARAQLDERYRFEGLIGKSPVMKRLFQLLETVARVKVWSVYEV